jgi:hypothetical protein
MTRGELNVQGLPHRHAARHQIQQQAWTVVLEQLFDRLIVVADFFHREKRKGPRA